MQHLNGFHLMERYIVGKQHLSSPILRYCLVFEYVLIVSLLSPLIVLFHHPPKAQQAALVKAELKAREEALAEEKKKLGMTD